MELSQPVEHVLRSFSSGHRNLIELDQIVLNELKPGRLEKNRTPIHMLLLVMGHCARARLSREDALVVALLQLGQEILIELLGPELLQAYYVRIEILYVV